MGTCIYGSMHLARHRYWIGAPGSGTRRGRDELVLSVSICKDAGDKGIGMKVGPSGAPTQTKAGRRTAYGLIIDKAC